MTRRRHSDGLRRAIRGRPWASMIACSLLALLFVVPLSGRRNPVAPNVEGPSLAALNAAISNAEGYLDGLYKPLPDGEQAVQSETYGLPLRVYFPYYGKWVLIGEGHAGQCLSGNCKSATSLKRGDSGPTTESFTVAFDSPQVANAVRMRIQIDWAVAPGKFALTFGDPLELRDQKTTADVYLDDKALFRLKPGVSLPVRRVLATSDRAVLRSLRYTVRHAVQESYLYWRYRGTAQRSDALASFLRANDYVAGRDIRAIMFAQAQGLPDDFVLQKQAYPDCDHLPEAGDTAYPYASKVCITGVDGFLLAGRSDPFLQIMLAMQVLEKHGDPDRRYRGLAINPLSKTSPSATADGLEAVWRKLGYGIPTCSLLGCDARASALRTYMFGSLEAVLGYRYGQPERRAYSDAAAAQALATQIDARGLIRTPNGSFLRPAQAGGFPLFWNDLGQYAPPEGVTAQAKERLSMPPEFGGLIASDSETTFDGFAFLITYRCAKFGVGCSYTPAAT
jgi:hypothetical protein